MKKRPVCLKVWEGVAEDHDVLTRTTFAADLVISDHLVLEAQEEAFQSVAQVAVHPLVFA